MEIANGQGVAGFDGVGAHLKRYGQLGCGLREHVFDFENDLVRAGSGQRRNRNGGRDLRHPLFVLRARPRPSSHFRRARRAARPWGRTPARSTSGGLFRLPIWCSRRRGTGPTESRPAACSNPGGSGAPPSIWLMNGRTICSAGAALSSAGSSARSSGRIPSLYARSTVPGGDSVRCATPRLSRRLPACRSRPPGRRPSRPRARDRSPSRRPGSRRDCAR